MSLKYHIPQIGPDDNVSKRRAQADTTTVGHAAASKIWSITNLGGSTEELCMEWIKDSDALISPNPMLRPNTMQIYMFFSDRMPGDEQVRFILKRF
ncbi:hypothetical protein FRB95_005372 [Tulasnella sp. JGI-2019a]|nr:hypothetical protein FRB93_011238 [Tulasnella sp. JGI-2019a]KAG9029365.1 hypothetical protein FRB95_005372 [Tulasnella sp. JGI-2019a]